MTLGDVPREIRFTRRRQNVKNIELYFHLRILLPFRNPILRNSWRGVWMNSFSECLSIRKAIAFLVGIELFIHAEFIHGITTDGYLEH